MTLDFTTLSRGRVGSARRVTLHHHRHRLIVMMVSLCSRIAACTFVVAHSRGGDQLIVGMNRTMHHIQLELTVLEELLLG